MICKICNSKNTTITYHGKIRNGAPGNMTRVTVDVLKCSDCGTIWHDPIDESAADYNSDSYRESMGENVSLQAFYSKHDCEIIDKLNYTGTSIYRDKLFCDIGVGGGGCADYVRGVAKDVLLVEPNKHFADLLRGKGYEVFAYGEDALEKYRGKIEVLTSWDVIEHVDAPMQFLKTAYDLLAVDGKAYIGTPTEYPVLRNLLGAEFDEFVFSVQHPWVFSRKSLEIMSENVGFTNFEVKFYQRFGVGNLIAWLQKRKPCGESKYDFITSALNAVYKSEMAKEETAEYLLLELKK
jgi:2-polyprenyl-3-methyl-5-hydroxy-6-metoxy-1,4-benzoquinol methylase